MRQYAPFLKMYTEYVQNFDSAMHVIGAWKEKSPRFAALLQELQVNTNKQVNIVHSCVGETRPIFGQILHLLFVCTFILMPTF